jgi:hypothetical protein
MIRKEFRNEDVNCIGLVGFEVFMEVTMKNAVLWDVAQCGLIINDVSEERIPSFFRLEEITQARNRFSFSILRTAVNLLATVQRFSSLALFLLL